LPGSVRIIGGQWRGTRLAVADQDGLRPTSDRTRETLFNWLQPVLPGARVLDLFAGSGALGFEALSRGAREALLVERDPRQCELLRDTARRLQGGDAAMAVGRRVAVPGIAAAAQHRSRRGLDRTPPGQQPRDPLRPLPARRVSARRH
jgi:16S rRNA (guanine(966)-N(2))-methyltransferase RsmD